jgi:hypothetical protein
MEAPERTTFPRRELLAGGAALGTTAVGGCAATSRNEDGGATDSPTVAQQTDDESARPVVPDIVVYEADGTGYAATGGRTYSGAGIFAAAQQAIDARLEAESGNVHVFVKQGEYELHRGLVIDQPGVDRLTLVSAGPNQVWLKTHNITDQPAAITVDPGPVPGGAAAKRIYDVTIEGLRLDDDRRDGRPIDGIYVNDPHQTHLSGCVISRGFRRGLWLRNVWQGSVDNVLVGYCGSNTASTPAVQLGHPDDTDVHQAINHVQLNHLQGRADQYAFLEARGTATRIDIEYPNPELIDLPGFVFDGGDGLMNVQLRGPMITGGAPAVQVTDGAELVVCGGRIGAEATAIAGRGGGVPKVRVGGGVRLLGGESDPVVDLHNAWVDIHGSLVEFGQRGIVLTNCGFANVTGVRIRKCSQAGLKVSNMERVASNYSGLLVAGSATEGEHPILFEGVHNAAIDAVVHSPERAVAPLRRENCANVTVGTLVAAGEATAPRK